MKFVSLIKRAPKRAGMLAAAMFAMVALPINSVMAADVRIEGSIGVANQTAKQTEYKPSTNAKYDEVVKFSVYYHNRQLAGSGKVAEDLKIKVDMPTAAGKSQVVKVQINGSNTNVVRDTATVNLDRNDARLEFIKGSVQWTHNTGTRENIKKTTEQINDSIILDGKRLENVRPCHEFEATVTFLARVKVDSVSVTKKVREEGKGQAQVNLSAQPNARLEYLITVKNLGNTNLTNVMVRDALPASLTFVPGTAKLFNGPNPNGVVVNSAALFGGGVNAGNIGPGATVYFTFIATLPAAANLQCGANSFKNIAVVDTDQTGEYNNNAIVTTNKVCDQAAPAYKCDSLAVTAGANRTVTINSLKYTATNGATFKDVSYDFGDGTSPLVTDKTSGLSHTYAKDGEYNIVATVRFNVNNQVQSSNCTYKVIYQGGTPVVTTPEELPNTGAGEVIGLFAAVTAAGALMHRFVLVGRRG